MKHTHVLASYAGPSGLLTVDLSLARAGIRCGLPRVRWRAGARDVEES